MHQKLCFARQNVSGKMGGQACPAGCCGTLSFVPGCSGTDSSGIVLLMFLLYA